MKSKLPLIFKIIRVTIFLGIIIGSSIAIQESSNPSWIVLYSIFLITGIVGIFFEIYKK